MSPDRPVTWVQTIDSTMRKEKKDSRRLTKKQLSEKLTAFFQSQPDETFSFKQIFHAL